MDYGHYEFLIMSFGLISASSTFRTLMNSFSLSYLYRFMLEFFSDIMAYSKNLNEFLKQIDIIFSILRTHKLYVKKKCNFYSEETKCLGHMSYASRL